MPVAHRPPPGPGVPVPDERPREGGRGTATSVLTMGRRTTDDEESASAPPIPSFASLRGGGRPSPSDLLLSVPAARDAVAPPEWADLWRLGVRLARWCVRQPCTTVRRLIG